MSPHTRVNWKTLQKYSEEVLANAGLPEDEAAIVATSLVDADLAGMHSHGVSRVSDYLTRMDEGLVAKTTQIETVQETPTSALLDAHNGWGQVVSEEAVEVCIQKAKESGSAWVGVRNSNHYGRAAYWTSKIASEGMIGVSATNGSPVMVPYGSSQPSLGTNPLSIAAPSSSGKPVVLDMSTSIQARGRILIAAKEGGSIPEGWALTEDGAPTTDAREAWKGSLLPMAGTKGSGLAIMIDILAGVLTGANFGMGMPRMYEDSVPQQLGHIFAALDVESMRPMEDFLAAMNVKEEETRDSQPAQGVDQVYMPGDIEYLRQDEYRSDGIPLSQNICDELMALGRRYGVSAKLSS